MIRPPAGFAARREHDMLVFESSDGACTLRYIERLRPVPTVEALWGAPLAAPPRRLVTDEGEYAWIIDGSEDRAEGFAGRVLGGVIGDDFVAVLEAMSTTRDVHRGAIALVEHLLRADDHLLGTRRRQYLHAAPAGWLAEAHDAFHVTYRRDGAVIHVAPAIPARLMPREAVLASLSLPADTVAAPVTAPMAGTRWSGVSDRCIEAFLLEDGEYFYPAVAECTIEAVQVVERVLAEIMASVEPIPRPRARRSARLADGAFGRAIASRL